jgi:hypothetical protein
MSVRVGIVPDTTVSPGVVVMASSADDTAAIPSPTKSKKRLLIGGVLSLIVVIAASATAVLLFGNKSPINNQTNATSLSSQFVYDITHNKATAAYSLTIGNTGIQSDYPPSGFATNVQNLSALVTGNATEKSQKTTSINVTTGGASSADSSAQISEPQTTTVYSVPIKTGSATVSVDALKNDSKWFILDVSVSPDSGNLAGIFDGTVGSYSATNDNATAATPNCPAVSGVALCSYTTQIDSVEVASVSVSVLFVQNATINPFPNASSINTSTSQLMLNYLRNSSTSIVQPCTTDPTNSGPELFSFTSNGTSQVACGGKTPSSNGSSYAYTYGGIVSINGIDYGISLSSQSPIANSVIEAIFSSVKPG